jgi:hypothetical protein
MNYPLNLEHVSARLTKGKGSIYLDNKDHAILEHCRSPDGNKLIATSLGITLLVDVGHFEEAKAHRNSVNEQLGDQETVRFSSLVSISVFSFKLLLQSGHRPDSEAEDIFVSHTAGPGLTSVPHPESQVTPPRVKTRPKPRPIFGKKRRISEGSQSTIRVQKRTRSDNIGGPSHMAAPVEDIRLALIAQHEPQPDDINGLCTYSLMSGSM